MKRIIALTLSAAAVCSVLLTAGCGRNRPAKQSSSSHSTSASTQTSDSSASSDSTASSDSRDGSSRETGTAPPEPQDLAWSKAPGFESLTFGGKTFVIAGSAGKDPRWESAKEIYSDDAGAVSSAVRERNMIVESLYDCKIELVTAEDPAELAMSEVTANKHTIDVFSATGFGKTMAESGNIYNLYSLGIDFSHDWWDPAFVSAYTVKKTNGTYTLYALMGDFCLSALAATHAIIVNKNVLETSTIAENPYELVRNHEWTVDKFAEMVRLGAKDTSGNSSLAFEEGDVLGWARTAHAAHGLHTASALPIVETRNGTFVFSPSDDPAAWTNIMDRAISVWHTAGAETLGYTNVQRAIVANRALFASEVIDVLERMRDAEDVRLGLLPYPLYSASQENYAHYVDNHVFTYHVPVSVEETDSLADFLEVFGYHSRYTVRPAFINTYSYEYCSDPESEEMLQLILNSRSYDPGYHFWSTPEGDLSQMIASSNNNIAQWAEKRKTTVSSEIAGYIGRISETEA